MESETHSASYSETHSENQMAKIRNNKETKRRILASVVILLVIAAISFIELSKPKRQGKTGNAADAADASATKMSVPEKERKYQKAPEFAGIESWINSEPLKMSGLRGKVVLVDFWTYTCINCIRTLPYIKAWDEKYRSQGLVIIGVHTPEFAFEKDRNNVIAAAEKYGLKYPIAQDNDYATWNAYSNRYWPHKFLIDADGYIRYDHIGEGNYEETEKVIQELLKEANASMKINTSVSNPEAGKNFFGGVGTPEIYFGYAFTRGNFGNPEGLKAGTFTYSLPQKRVHNHAYLNGTWRVNKDNVELESDEGIVVLEYSAKAVNIVAGSDTISNAIIFLDGIPVGTSNENNKITGKGTDVGEDGVAAVNDYRLYNIVDADYGVHTVTINIKGKGFKLFTFTFG